MGWTLDQPCRTQCRLGSPLESKFAACDSSIEHALEVEEESERLQQLFVRLSDRQREAIVLRYFEQLSVQEVANARGIASGTAKATLWQALRSLRKWMKNETFAKLSTGEKAGI